jgi:hypothetical protein
MMSDEKKVLWTPKRKQEIVLRLLKGESPQEVAREPGLVSAGQPALISNDPHALTGDERVDHVDHILAHSCMPSGLALEDQLLRFVIWNVSIIAPS